jgi:hypothetical protein
MTEERYVTLDALLPANPEPGEIFKMPEGQIGGASVMNFIYAGGQHIGHTAQYARVTNVSACSRLGRTVSSVPLMKGLNIRLLCEQFTFKSLIFVDYFGWTVYEYNPKPTVLLDELFTVTHASTMYKANSKLYVYDDICLEKYKEESDARKTNDAARDAARNDTRNAAETSTGDAEDEPCSAPAVAATDAGDATRTTGTTAPSESGDS